MDLTKILKGEKLRLGFGETSISTLLLIGGITAYCETLNSNIYNLLPIFLLPVLLLACLLDGDKAEKSRLRWFVWTIVGIDVALSLIYTYFNISGLISMPYRGVLYVYLCTNALVLSASDKNEERWINSLGNNQKMKWLVVFLFIIMSMMVNPHVNLPSNIYSTMTIICNAMYVVALVLLITLIRQSGRMSKWVVVGVILMSAYLVKYLYDVIHNGASIFTPIVYL